MITKAEILMGREKQYPLTPEMEKNLLELLVVVNKLRDIWGKPMIVTSGYRPAEINALLGGSLKSKHITCQAVDILDTNGLLAEFLVNNQNILQDLGLWMESPIDTNTNKGRWVHLQTVSSKSGLRIFRARPAALSVS